MPMAMLMEYVMINHESISLQLGLYMDQALGLAWGTPENSMVDLTPKISRDITITPIYNYWVYVYVYIYILCIHL